MSDDPHFHGQMDQISRLWWTVFGIDGTNGLRGTSRQHEDRISKLEAYAAQINALWMVLRWLCLALVATVGLVVSQPVGQIIGRMLIAGAQP